MTFQLKEQINEKFSVDTDKFVSALRSHTSPEFERIPDKSFTGTFNGNTFHFKINSSLRFVGSFRSDVDGTISKEGNSSKLQLKVTPNWTIWKILALWTSLLFPYLTNVEFGDTRTTIVIIIKSILFVLIPLILAKTKLSYDTKRLKVLITEIVANFVIPSNI